MSSIAAHPEASRHDGTRSTLRRGFQHAPWRAWLSLLLLALLVKLLFVLTALAVFGTSPDPISALVREWQHWDANHYVYLSENGYATTGDARNLIAFFPLYPALIAALGVLGIAKPIGALVISNVAGLFATLFLYELGRLDHEEGAGFRAAVLFNIFPTSYFLFAGYTEGVFCAFAFGSVLLARSGRWLASGILAGLGSLTRLTGLALLPSLAFEAYEQRGSLRQTWTAWAPLLLIPAGFAAYLAVNWLVLGNPLAFVQVQSQHWYHRLAPPWVGLWEAIRGIGWRDPWERFTVGFCEAIAGLTAYAVTILSWLRLRRSDAIYAGAVTVLITFLPFWLSIPRYLLTVYPLFLLAGRIRNRAVQYVGAAVSFAALLLFSLAFARGIWAF